MKYDLIVIGSGPGGYVAAIRGAQNGLKTAIIERAELGGVCLNWGCIPTKAMLRSAEVFSSTKTASEYGIELDCQPIANLEKIVERSRGVADTMNRGVAFLLKKNGVDVIVGEGKPVASGLVEVNGERFEAAHIILATGSRPRSMPAFPIDGEHIISSREALLLKELPPSISIIGSGAIGCEFAYLYATLGAHVTIIEYLPRLLPIADEDVSKTLERTFRKQKIVIKTAANVKKVEIINGQCHLTIETAKGEEIIITDKVLSAVGIKSNIEPLDLEQLGIAVERDKIVVDANYKTSVNGIYAIGDLIATPALAHVASAEALQCVDKICGHHMQPIDYEAVPSCIYTSPEIAWVGLTEAQAHELIEGVRVGMFPFTASGKATAAGHRDGFVKLIIAPDDTLLGAHMVGANVTELLTEPTLVKTLGIKAEQLLKSIHAHPTMSEALAEATEAALGKAIHT